MTTENTQAVVDEPKAVAEPTVEGNDARKEGDDLDTLLAQYQQETAKPEPVSPPAQAATTTETPKSDPMVSQLMNRLMQEDIDKVTGKIAKELNLPEKLTLDLVDGLAKRNKAIADAFVERFNGNPQKWNKLEPAIIKQIAKELEPIRAVDTQTTADVAAVAAAVRGSSTKPQAEPPPNLGRMNNAELRQHYRDTYGFDPGF